MALDGDPLDITFPGCVIESRVIGFLNMIDGGEDDQKLLAVPVKDPRFKDVHTLDDVPEHKLKEIAHFFQTYKDLQNKKTEIGEWEGIEAANNLIDECLARYKNS